MLQMHDYLNCAPQISWAPLSVLQVSLGINLRGAMSCHGLILISGAISSPFIFLHLILSRIKPTTASMTATSTTTTVVTATVMPTRTQRQQQHEIVRDELSMYSTEHELMTIMTVTSLARRRPRPEKARLPSKTLIDPLAASVENLRQGFPAAVKSAAVAAEYTKDIEVKAGRSMFLTKEYVADSGASSPVRRYEQPWSTLGAMSSPIISPNLLCVALGLYSCDSLRQTEFQRTLLAGQIDTNEDEGSDDNMNEDDEKEGDVLGSQNAVSESFRLKVSKNRADRKNISDQAEYMVSYATLPS
ncbi:hypothetical protein BDZ89DRAFT_1040587 [Hymenopellis radicata]|nr:hypothetical protein BDZ89DRAFT_1040587 [Hymenopellis radicata]